MGQDVVSRLTVAPSAPAAGFGTLYPLGASDAALEWYFKRPNGDVLTLAHLEGAQTFTGALTLTAASPQLTLGVLNTTSGGIKFFGSTSGNVTLAPNVAAGASVTVTLPATTVTLNAAGDLTGTTLAAGVVASSLTSVGTLTGLGISGVLASTNTTDTTGANGAITTLGAIYAAKGIRTAGPITGHLANSMLMTYEGTSFGGGIIYVTGENASTNAAWKVDSIRSDGSNTITLISATNAGAVTIPGTTVNMTTSGTTLTVGVGADNGTVSAGVFTDRTKHFDGDAVGVLKAVKAKNGHIDHATLPAFARANVKKQSTDADGKVTETIEVERDLGAMLSILTVAVGQLDARLDTLERRP